jgi:hypothetical protein
VGWDWVRLVRRPLTGILYQPRMIDDECRAVSGIRIGRRNRNTRRKPAQVSLCSPQIPHDLTWARTAAVGSQRLTAWAMARPLLQTKMNGFADLNEYNICKCVYRKIRSVLLICYTVHFERWKICIFAEPFTVYCGTSSFLRHIVFYTKTKNDLQFFWPIKQADQKTRISI